MILSGPEVSIASFLFELSSATEPAADKLTRKLRSFASLPNGWDFGDGLPVSTTAIEIAEELLRWASQLQLKADVFPGVDGECMVAFYNDNRCVRVIVQPSGSFDLRVERGIGFTFEHTVPPQNGATRQEAFARVRDLVDTAWNTYVFLVSGSTIERVSGSLTTPLRSPVPSMAAASPS